MSQYGGDASSTASGWENLGTNRSVTFNQSSRSAYSSSRSVHSSYSGLPSKAYEYADYTHSRRPYQAHTANSPHANTNARTSSSAAEREQQLLEEAWLRAR